MSRLMQLTWVFMGMAILGITLNYFFGIDNYSPKYLSTLSLISFLFDQAIKQLKE